jgi:PadR family transcriptional regulator, regulatory protein PadR
MSQKSQMFKGVLEMCILSVITEQRSYGYEISEKLASRGFSFVSEGTIYPILLRLQNEGAITAEYLPSPTGPPRKYYETTEAGKEKLSTSIAAWRELQEAVDRTIERSSLDSSL